MDHTISALLETRRVTPKSSLKMNASMPQICPNPNLGEFDICTPETCCIELYGSTTYYPTKAGNGVYLGIFVILLVAQIALGVRARTWGFLSGMIGGLLLEIIGYGGRLWMAQDIFSQDPFLLYLVPITIGPAFITAAIYLCLARIVPVYGHAYSYFKPRTYTILFVLNDFISLLLQAAGGAIASIADGGSGLQDTGINIMIAGLAYQVVSLGIFMAAMAYFAFKVSRANSRGSAFSTQFARVRSLPKFKFFLIALPIATTLIFVRCVYRVAELHEGFDGALANSEVSFMILEGPMVFIAVTLLTFFHPGLAFDGQWREANFSLRGRKVPKGTEGVRLESGNGFKNERTGVAGKNEEAA